MITIHIDFVASNEVSYIEGLELLHNNPQATFNTNCLTFFSNTWETNVIVIDRHGRSIDRDELMSNTGYKYTDRQMRKGHNIYNMLISNAFTWKQPVEKDVVTCQQ